MYVAARSAFHGFPGLDTLLHALSTPRGIVLEVLSTASTYGIQQKCVGIREMFLISLFPSALRWNRSRAGVHRTFTQRSSREHESHAQGLYSISSPSVKPCGKSISVSNWDSRLCLQVAVSSSQRRTLKENLLLVAVVTL